MEPVTIVLWIAAGVLIVIGALGLILPILPGAPLIFLGALLAAWAEGFQYIGLWTLIGLGALSALAVAVDFIAGAFGAQRFGASGRAVTGATLGAIVGLFFGVVGVLVGPFVGAVIGELSVRRNLARPDAPASAPRSARAWHGGKARDRFRDDRPHRRRAPPGDGFINPVPAPARLQGLNLENPGPTKWASEDFTYCRRPGMVIRVKDPFATLLGLQHAMESVMGSDWFGGRTSGSGAFPLINVFNDGDDFVVVAELPGVKKDDLEIEVRGDTVRIHGKQQLRTLKVRASIGASARPASSIERSRCPTTSMQRRSLRIIATAS